MGRSYLGSIIHVDLSKAEISIENPPDDFYRKYGGGSAMGLYYILHEMAKGTDPFSPAAVLTMFTGIPTGLAISGQSRLSINARSPRAGAIGDSQGGGFFPAALKFAGFDGIVVKGKSASPVYLYIHNGEVELRDAKHLWGKVTAEVDEILKKEIGDGKIEILQIGPSGEKLVRFASIMNMSNRANGRTGMGAVMGSKLLKAVVVQGKRKLEVADADAIKRIGKKGPTALANNLDVRGLSKNGTADVVVGQNAMGTLPTRNYSEGQFEGYEAISGDRLTETVLKEQDTCYACVIRCKRVVETEYKGQKVLPVYGGPEYETIATMGSYCGVADLSAISLANQMCNMYGMDTISCGATVAFAMECFESGLITSKDTEGIELRFGNADSMLAMIEKIAHRDGFGDLLAEGSDRAAAKIGGKAQDFLITVKGNEAPAHMPQAKKTLGLIYAVNPFGADHQSSEHDPAIEEGTSELNRQRLAMIGVTELQSPGSMNLEKVKLAFLSQCFYSALDSFNLCQFVWGPAWELFGPDDMAEMLKAATGWDYDIAEILKVGERRLNMMRAFNAREGFDRDLDKLPVKFATPLKGTGPSAGVIWDPNLLEEMKDLYYQMAGWETKTGNPSLGKLTELGLEWINL